VLPKLLRFILRTRFSRPFLILLGIIVLYAVIATSLTTPSDVATVLSYEGTAVVAFFFAMSLATGGVMVMKSDRDYLFTLPLSPRDLSISIFFSQFIAYGASILFILIYLAPGFSSPLLAVDVIALALTVTSLGIIATSLQTRMRLFLSVALACWTLLALENVPFTPASAFNGNLYAGTATLLLLTTATTTAAVRGLSRVELDMMRNLIRTSSADVKAPTSFAGKSPIGAIYSMNIANLSIAGRMNMAGTSRYVSRRVRTQWVLAASSVAAVAYFVFALYAGDVQAASGTDTFPGAVIVAVILSFLGFFFSQSAITNERIWLSLTSLPPVTYFRHLIGSKLLSLMIILTPFAVADAVLAALGYPMELAGLVIVLTVIPASFVLQICFSAYMAPIQVKGDDMMMPAQFNLRQMATGLLIIPVIFLATLSAIFPLVAVAGGLALCLLSALLVFSAGFWSRVVTKLTENGFV
jgi:hypothetical protein